MRLSQLWVLYLVYIGIESTSNTSPDGPTQPASVNPPKKSIEEQEVELFQKMPWDSTKYSFSCVFDRAHDLNSLDLLKQRDVLALILVKSLQCFDSNKDPEFTSNYLTLSQSISERLESFPIEIVETAISLFGPNFVMAITQKDIQLTLLHILGKIKIMNSIFAKLESDSFRFLSTEILSSFKTENQEKVFLEESILRFHTLLQKHEWSQLPTAMLHFQTQLSLLHKNEKFTGSFLYTFTLPANPSNIHFVFGSIDETVDESDNSAMARSATPHNSFSIRELNQVLEYAPLNSFFESNGIAHDKINVNSSVALVEALLNAFTDAETIVQYGVNVVRVFFDMILRPMRKYWAKFKPQSVDYLMTLSLVNEWDSFVETGAQFNSLPLEEFGHLFMKANVSNDWMFYCSKVVKKNGGLLEGEELYILHNYDRTERDTRRTERLPPVVARALEQGGNEVLEGNANLAVTAPIEQTNVITTSSGDANNGSNNIIHGTAEAKIMSNLRTAGGVSNNSGKVNANNEEGGLKEASDDDENTNNKNEGTEDCEQVLNNENNEGAGANACASKENGEVTKLIKEGTGEVANCTEDPALKREEEEKEAILPLVPNQVEALEEEIIMDKQQLYKSIKNNSDLSTSSNGTPKTNTRKASIKLSVNIPPAGVNFDMPVDSHTPMSGMRLAPINFETLAEEVEVLDKTPSSTHSVMPAEKENQIEMDSKPKDGLTENSNGELEKEIPQEEQLDPSVSQCMEILAGEVSQQQGGEKEAQKKSRFGRLMARCKSFLPEKISNARKKVASLFHRSNPQQGSVATDTTKKPIVVEQPKGFNDSDIHSWDICETKKDGNKQPRILDGISKALNLIDPRLFVYLYDTVPSKEDVKIEFKTLVATYLKKSTREERFHLISNLSKMTFETQIFAYIKLPWILKMASEEYHVLSNVNNVFESLLNKILYPLLRPYKVAFTVDSSEFSRKNTRWALIAHQDIVDLDQMNEDVLNCYSLNINPFGNLAISTICSLLLSISSRQWMRFAILTSPYSGWIRTKYEDVKSKFSKQWQLVCFKDDEYLTFANPPIDVNNPYSFPNMITKNKECFKLMKEIESELIHIFTGINVLALFYTRQPIPSGTFTRVAKVMLHYGKKTWDTNQFLSFLAEYALGSTKADASLPSGLVAANKFLKNYAGNSFDSAKAIIPQNLKTTNLQLFNPRVAELMHLVYKAHTTKQLSSEISMKLGREAACRIYLISNPSIEYEEDNLAAIDGKGGKIIVKIGREGKQLLEEWSRHNNLYPTTIEYLSSGATSSRPMTAFHVIVSLKAPNVNPPTAKKANPVPAKPKQPEGTSNPPSEKKAPPSPTIKTKTDDAPPDEKKPDDIPCQTVDSTTSPVGSTQKEPSSSDGRGWIKYILILTIVAVRGLAYYFSLREKQNKDTSFLKESLTETGESNSHESNMKTEEDSGNPLAKENSIPTILLSTDSLTPAAPTDFSFRISEYHRMEDEKNDEVYLNEVFKRDSSEVHVPAPFVNLDTEV